MSDASVDHIPGYDSLFELPRMLKDPTGFLKERHRKFGDVFRTTFIKPIVFLIGPEANKTVLVTGRDLFSYQKGFGPLAFARLFQGSLLLLDGEPHKHERDILQPAMGRMALGGALATIQESWNEAADRIGEAGGVHDAYELLARTTFEVSANALVGLNLKDELEETRPLFQALVDGTMASTQLRIPFLKLDRGLKARERLIEILSPKIEASRTGEPRGMLGLLAHHREADGTPLPTRKIAEHLLLLYWAGYDTTASTGSWALWELANAPQWQERLHAEQQAVLGEGPLTMETALPVQGYVLKEIERMRPAALFFPRGLVGDVEVAGLRVPKGTTVMYSPYLTHRIESLFPEPETFKPERWDPSAGKPAPATALVGFGGGPRICLGKAFALLQLKVMLTTLLSRFRWEPARGTKMVPVPLPIYHPTRADLHFHRRHASASKAA